MKKEIKECDISNREHNADTEIRTYTMDVVFTTEQNEGRATSPYIDNVTLELCSACRNEILIKRKMITAVGAMGYNKYEL